MDIGYPEIIFIFTAVLTIAPGFIVAFSRNILYSAFSLFFTFLGTSGLYFFLRADFLAIVQLVVYIGGVLVLLLFALLLTKNIRNIRLTNTASPKRAVAAGIASTAVFFGIAALIIKGDWIYRIYGGAGADSTIRGMGELLLTKYMLAFEAVSVLLLAVLVGSLVVAGRVVR